MTTDLTIDMALEHWRSLIEAEYRSIPIHSWGKPDGHPRPYRLNSTGSPSTP
jgi:hypothetical protein